MRISYLHMWIMLVYKEKIQATKNNNIIEYHNKKL